MFASPFWILGVAIVSVVAQTSSLTTSASSPSGTPGYECFFNCAFGDGTREIAVVNLQCNSNHTSAQLLANCIVAVCPINELPTAEELFNLNCPQAHIAFPSFSSVSPFATSTGIGVATSSSVPEHHSNDKVFVAVGVLAGLLTFIILYVLLAVFRVLPDWLWRPPFLRRSSRRIETLPPGIVVVPPDMMAVPVEGEKKKSKLSMDDDLLVERMLRKAQEDEERRSAMGSYA